MTMKSNNKGNKFYIEVEPEIIEGGEFTGNFYLQILASPTTISKDSFERVEQICQLGCAALSLMQEDDEFRETLYDFMTSPPVGDNDNQLIKPTVVDVTENIITLNFNKETKH